MAGNPNYRPGNADRSHHLFLVPKNCRAQTTHTDNSFFIVQCVAPVYYVITGDGQVTAGSETADIHAGDAVPIKLDVQKSFVNTGSAPLEFLIVGVAMDFATKDAMMAQAPKL
jgi:mannose-6-phosphate isomerase-like protein (cupin superfamily)